MKLLVVGGSGFIGRQFLEHADLSGLEVSATYHADQDFPAYLKSLNPSYKAVPFDLLESKTDLGAYDAAVYTAGNSNHTWALEHTDSDMMLNAVGFARFLKSFHGDLVLMSTGAVYFGHEGKVSPESKTAPSSPTAPPSWRASCWPAGPPRTRSSGR